VRLNRSGDRSSGRSGWGLSLSGWGGRDNSATMRRGHVAWGGREDGWRVASAVLGSLDGLDRGRADGRLGHWGAMDEVSRLYPSGRYRIQVSV
jgi:hypothetical protein